MLFCNTPYQSIFIAVLAGLLGGLISIWSGLQLIGILIGCFTAFILEFGIHEIRQDKQYKKAKQKFISQLKNRNV